MTQSVIVAGARTPMGRLLGSLKDFSGAQLGGVAIKAALERAGVAPEQVQYVIMGQVLTAGAGQIPARQAAVAGGIPMDVPALTINKVCLSGIDAIALADQLIRVGEFEIVVAGGQESMTQAPHLLTKSREGYKFGEVTALDHMAHDGLYCAFDQCAMGAATEKFNSRYQLGRQEQDEFAARSHQLAAKAASSGVFAEEIAPVTVPQRKGDPKVVMSKAKAEELGLPWLAEIGAHGVVAGPDASLHEQPANAIAAACRKEGIEPGDLDLVEINEAFAAVGVVSTRKLGLDPEQVNVNGGAIALGHPIGMSGARIALHLALELRRRGGGVGAAALCGGGGQGDGLVIRVPSVS